MRFLHLGDIHLGKRVRERLMIDEQQNIIDQLIEIAKEQDVDGVLIAGDVFDKSVPSKDAFELCEDMYSRFLGLGIQLFVIPGNHDSAHQVSFCSGIIEKVGLHIAKEYSGKIDVCRMEKGDEVCDIHLLPFVRPLDVRTSLTDRAAEINSYDDAVRIALEEHQIDESALNILVAHQFVVDGLSSPETCDSETISVGGIDNVEARNFDAFDYVALGHLHGRQKVRRKEVRYCGSPLKYSFSEISQKKVATVVDISCDGVEIEEFELTPIHQMREITASIEDLERGCDVGDHEDYMHITLTDKSAYDAASRIRAIYPNFLRLDWEESLVETAQASRQLAQMEEKDPVELFEDFFLMQTGEELGEDERHLIEAVVEEKGTRR